MTFTKDQLLARLKELKVEFAQYEHPTVLTVEAQAKYVGGKGGGLSKNLFLKDKKNRFYIVSALADTKVDLKVLASRLGLGKGGVRMAPEEALSEILQVPLGCVTPFAVINDSARDVSLLLDERFKSQDYCFFHPLSNDISISLNACDLDKFFESIGRNPPYVDLEANPPVGKDQPPDLAAFVPSGSVPLPDPLEKAAPLQGPTQNSTFVNKMPTPTTVIVSSSVAPKDKAVTRKSKSASAVHQPNIYSYNCFVEDILCKTSTLLLSEITEDRIKQQGENLGAVVAENIRKSLTPDLKRLATMFQNTAYTEGFHAGVYHKRTHR